MNIHPTVFYIKTTYMNQVITLGKWHHTSSRLQSERLPSLTYTELFRVAPFEKSDHDRIS